MATDYPEARARMLASVLPAGEDVYVGLWDGNPINGGTELTLAGYARVAHQDWTTTVPMTGESIRSNSSEIIFAPITEAGQASYWSIHEDAVEPSVLLRSGLLLDDLNQPVVIVFGGVSDDVQFNIGALRIKIRDE